jgi:O-antigen/teichoic acid export membrane protein
VPEILAAGFAVAFFANSTVSPLAIVAVVALYYVSRGFNTHYSERARAQNAVLAYTVLQIAGPVGGLFAGFVAIEFVSPSALNLLAAYGLMQVLGTIVALPLIGFSLRPGRPDMTILKEAFASGGPMLLLNCLSWLAENNIRYVIDEIGGPATFGLMAVGWGIGRRCASVASMLVAAAAFPLAARLINEGDHEGAMHQLTVNAALLTAVLLPSMVGLALVGDQLINLAVADAYRPTTHDILALSAFAGMVRFYHLHVSGQALVLDERYVRIGILHLVETALVAALAVIGFRASGLVGVVFGALVASSLTLALSCYWAISLSSLRLPVRDSLKIGLATALMALAVWLVPVRSGVTSLALSIGVGGLVYTLAMSVIYFSTLRPMVERQFGRFRG